MTAKDAEPPPEAISPADLTVELVADRFLDVLLEADPLSATKIGDHRWDDRLPDIGEAGRASAESSYRSVLAQMAAVPAQSLGPEARVTHDMVMTTARDLIDRLQVGDYRAAVSHIDGVQTLPTDIARYHAADTEDGLAALLDRFAAYPALMEDQVTALREGIAEGRSAALHPVLRTVTAIDELLAAPGSSSPIAVLVRVADDAARQRVAEAVDRWILPPLARFRGFLTDTYRSEARATAGLCSMRGGDAAYASAIRLETTLDLEPREIHRIGLEEASQIKVEMEELASQLGFASRHDARLALAAAPPADPPALLLEMARDQVRSAMEACAGWFTRVPPTACLVAAVEPYRTAVEAGASYVPAAADGSREGAYFLNLELLKSLPPWLLAAITFHESAPGHHFQLATELGRVGAGRFRRLASSLAHPQLFSGFIEGWGLYAERLADEMGLYRSLEERFGMLELQDGRAWRLVVDTGIHALGWTREAAIQCMVDADEGVSDLVGIEFEVDRYTTLPAQALCYKLGQREIEEARRAAAAEMGGEFDLRVFHDQVIGHGSVPLAILRREIVGWMKAAAASP